MDDRIKKFISEHRDEFDFREPDPAIWKEIEADIRVKRELKWRVIVARAAAVVLIFVASYGVNELVHRVNSRKNQASETPGGNAGNTVPGLHEAEAYYTGLVNQRLDELKPIIANCPSIKEELNFDMSELDSVYLDLKADLKDNMDNQEVVEAIIENYRLKIRILEDLLSEMDPREEECISSTNTHAL
jgi:hypothetical protein